MDRNGSMPCWNPPSYLHETNLVAKQFWRTCSLYSIYWICQSSNSYFIFPHSAVLYTHVVEKGKKNKAVEKMITGILWDGWICLLSFCPHCDKRDFFFFWSPFFFLFSLKHTELPWVKHKAAGASAEEQSTTPAALCQVSQLSCVLRIPCA